MSEHAEHTPEAIKKHVRVYLMVFAALAVLTLVTVGVGFRVFGVLHADHLKMNFFAGGAEVGRCAAAPGGR